MRKSLGITSIAVAALALAGCASGASPADVTLCHRYFQWESGSKTVPENHALAVFMLDGPGKKATHLVKRDISRVMVWYGIDDIGKMHKAEAVVNKVCNK